MEEVPKKELLVAYAGQDLYHLKNEFEKIQGSWNGEDSQFTCEGELYHEDHATAAGDIVEKIDELLAELDAFYEL